MKDEKTMRTMMTVNNIKSPVSAGKPMTAPSIINNGNSRHDWSTKQEASTHS